MHLPSRLRQMGVAYVLTLVAFAAPAWSQTQFRGVWVDAFNGGFKSQAQVDALVSRCVAGRYNAIVAEVLAYHDNTGGGHGAYWNSSIVPKATDISPSNFNPLAYLCQQAHASGIEVHAWLVTYRACTVWPPSGNSTVAAHPEWIMITKANYDGGGGLSKVDTAYTFDSGSPEVQEYLVSIVRELVTNYEIDGINWDYIRHTVTDAGYPSNSSYYYSGLKRYWRIQFPGVANPAVPLATDTNWSNFRRRGIDELIRRVRAEIPSIPNPRQPLRHTADLICFGSAPACGSFTSTSAYNLFQNWNQWMQNGWLDAAMPMDYKEEHCASEASQYRSWADRSSCWKNPTHKRHWFNGQATYLNSFANSKTQIEYCQSKPDIQGVVTYSYVGTTNTETICDANSNWATDNSWYTSYVPTNLWPTPVATPSMPWRYPATATEGTIWGRVRDWDTGEYLDDATVTVAGQAAVKTDGNGYYVVTLVPATAAGTNYAVTVTKSGFPTFNYPAATIIAGSVARYDFTVNAPAPLMTVAPNKYQWFINVGQNWDPDTFTVLNQGGGTRSPLNYTITDNASWLSVTPGSGTHVGNEPANVHTINYTTGSLAVGTYTATITVSDPAALNNPQTVTVKMIVTNPPNPGDFDGDGDVDQTDLGYIQVCQTGEFIAPPPRGCARADIDGDDDVDVFDIEWWEGCVSGTNVPSNPNCLPF